MRSERGARSEKRGAREEIVEQGENRGARHENRWRIDIYGSSPIGGTPYDPSYFDNAKKSYSMDPSSSMEKEDEDVITYAPARIGKMLAAPEGGDKETDIDEVDAENAPVEYFNLMGLRISEPQANEIVIERQGSKVTKKLY